MCGALTGFEAARTIFDADPEGIDTSIGKIACAHTEARDGASFKMIRINTLIRIITSVMVFSHGRVKKDPAPGSGR